MTPAKRWGPYDPALASSMPVGPATTTLPFVSNRNQVDRLTEHDRKQQLGEFLRAQMTPLPERRVGRTPDPSTYLNTLAVGLSEQEQKEKALEKRRAFAQAVAQTYQPAPRRTWETGDAMSLLVGPSVRDNFDEPHPRGI